MKDVESINIDAIKRKSKIDIKRVLEKTTKTWYFNSNDALNNLLDDSKGGFAQVIFTIACTHVWRSPAARQEDHIFALIRRFYSAMTDERMSTLQKDLTHWAHIYK